METLKQAIEARQKEAQRQPDDTLVWLIAGGMLLRALLAVVTEPYAYDQNCFFSWALRIAQDGPGNFYAPDYFADYPPGYMLVLGLVGKLMGLLHLNFTQAAAWLLMSLVPILCAGGLVWAVWNIGLEAGNGDVRWANRAAGFAAFGPSLVYCTGVWMQIDEVVCFLMVLALWRLSRGKFWQGCLWYGAALAVKPQALLAGPVLAGMYDTVLRALRDEAGYWWVTYRKAFKRNFKASLVPGVLYTVVVTLQIFLVYFCFNMLYHGTNVGVPLWVATVLNLVLFQMLFAYMWPQVVLLDQPLSLTLKNSINCMIAFLPHALAAAIVQVLFWGVVILCMPLGLFLMLIFGFWFVTEVSCQIVYGDIDRVFHIEENIRKMKDAALEAALKEDYADDDTTEE